MNRRIVEKRVLKKSIKNLLRQFMLMIFFFLLGLNYTKIKPEMKNIFKKNLFENSFAFTKVKNIYDKYFSSNTNIEEKEKPVFGEKIEYIKKEEKDNLVTLTVRDNYPVPILEDGLIVLIDDEKIVVDQVDGVSVTYKNVLLKDHKIYDYLEQGEILGEVKENKLELLFENEGEEINYQKYF